MGSSGGGGNSGKVSYPAYLQTVHGEVLNDSGGDTLTLSLYDCINAALSNNPFTGVVAYDPASEMADLATALNNYTTDVAGLDFENDWETKLTQVKNKLVAELLSDTELNNDADAFRTKLEAQLTSDVLPRFQAGMRDTNSVLTSSFVIGQSILEDGIDREVANHLSKLRLSAYQDKVDKTTQITDSLLGKEIQKIEFTRTVAALTAEMNRVRILFQMESDKQQTQWDTEEASWRVNLFQNLANMIAAPSGGTAVYDNKDRKNSPWAGALSGAAAGASLGSTSGGGMGVGTGALIGAIAGYFTS